MPPLPLNAAALLMQRGAAALGIETSPAANAALSRDWAGPGRGCATPAPNAASARPAAPPVPKAASMSSSSRRPWPMAPSCERSASPPASSATPAAPSPASSTCRAARKNGNAAATSSSAAARSRRRDCLLLGDGLANGSGQVGRNFMAHTGLQLWGFFDAATEPWRGIPGGLISEDMHRPRGDDVDFVGGYLLQSIGVMPLTYAGQLARSAGPCSGAGSASTWPATTTWPASTSSANACPLPATTSS